MNKCIYQIDPLPSHIVNLCNEANITIHDFKHDQHLFYMNYSGNELKLHIPSLHKNGISSLNEKHFNVHGKSIAGKALGKQCRTVLDATAGLGGDSIMFAKMGLNVISIERTPAVFLLLNELIIHSQLSHKLKCYNYEAIDAIQTFGQNVEAIFLDPMYPPKAKSALPNIKMRALGVLSKNNDNDFQEVFQTALNQNVKRVVVKRPDHEEIIPSKQFLVSHKGKSVRYDVYSGKI